MLQLMKKHVQSRFSAEHLTSTFVYVFIAINLYVETQLVSCRLRQRLVRNVSALMRVKPVWQKTFIRRTSYVLCPKLQQHLVALTKHLNLNLQGQEWTLKVNLKTRVCHLYFRFLYWLNNNLKTICSWWSWDIFTKCCNRTIFVSLTSKAKHNDHYNHVLYLLLW